MKEKTIKNIKIVIAIISFLIIIVIGTNLSLLNYIYGPYKQNKTYNKNDNYNLEEYKWFFNDNVREIISILSYDNHTLYANLYKNKETNKWAIVVHGYGSTGKRMANIGKEYYDNGYNVLIIEQRAHGISKGPFITFGYKEKYDLYYWINYINENYEKDNNKPKIILHGVSMGASTIIETLGNMKDKPQNIEYAIIDCGYSSFEKELRNIIENTNIFISTDFLLSNIDFITSLVLRFSIYDIEPMTSVRNIDIPILFIHGKQDTFVPFEMVYENYNNARYKKEILTIEEGTHANCSIIDKDLYWNSIWNFIEKYKE